MYAAKYAGKHAGKHAPKVIPFRAQTGRAPQPVEQAAEEAVESAERIRNPRFRGLRLVAPGTPATSLPNNTQAQARRIVAQVEWEIEQQAMREGQHTFQMLHKDLQVLPVQVLESPMTVAQRLMVALWSFALSA